MSESHICHLRFLLQRLKLVLVEDKCCFLHHASYGCSDFLLKCELQYLCTDVETGSAGSHFSCDSSV